MKITFVLLLSLLISLSSYSQPPSQLPYYQIPDYPETYTAETVVARMIDGLGFRYYWATEGLRAEDLAFRPTKEARSARETLEHIHGLTQVVVSSIRGEIHMPVDVSGLSFSELRESTLRNIEVSSLTLKSGDVSLENLMIRFENVATEYPFWNQLNGPIADALWHVGQVVSFRRSSGNPFNAGVSVFTGRLRGE